MERARSEEAPKRARMTAVKDGCVVRRITWCGIAWRALASLLAVIVRRSGIACFSVRLLVS
jgi:hypothetical protein